MKMLPRFGSLKFVWVPRASSRQRLSCHITHCKTDKKFFWKSELKHFFLVLSYESYFSPISYSTKHASQEGSHRPESEDAVYGLKLIKASIYTNHPESVKTAGFHIRVIYTRFTTLIQLIKSRKNNKKTFFHQSALRGVRAGRQLPAIQTDSC